MKGLNFNNVTVLLIAIITVSCNSIFIPDPIDPRLPKYTELGNNVAGALVNDEIWRAEVNLYWGLAGVHIANSASVSIWPEKDSIVIYLPGQKGDINAIIEFHLKSAEVNSFEDLVKLEGSKIELDGDVNYACLIQDGNVVDKGIGQFYPTYIHKIGSSSKVIFAGTFGFYGTSSMGKEMQITYGRFDYKLDKESESDSSQNILFNQGNYE